MADESAATPNSSTTKQPASKDKECPFCRQAFTSSSLGRHLDLYIKEKNPKPPDDVHNVEEIRTLRGSITRRQARTSIKKDSSTPPSTKATPLRDQPSPAAQKTYSANLNAEDGTVRTFWNQPNWHATGVINDLPPLSEDEPTNVPRRRPLSRSASIKEDLTRRQRAVDERDRGQAAELALKEVLENVKSANARAHPSSPFDFNFFKLSFPQMYLRLSAPPELLTEPPLLNQTTWSVAPPGTPNCEILRGWLQDRLHDWRRKRETLRFGNDVLSNGVNGHSGIHAEDEVVNNEEAMYNEHLSRAHQKWAELSEKERLETWHYECTKALAREREQHTATTRRLEQAEQENLLLRNHMAQKNIVLDAKELFHDPPAVLPLTERSLSFLPNSPSWDFDNLLLKWKSRIRSARSTQYPLPSSPWTSSSLEPREQVNHRSTGSQHHAVPEKHSRMPNQDSLREQDQDQDQDLDDAVGEEEEEGDEDSVFEQKHPDDGGGGSKPAEPNIQGRGRGHRTRKATRRPSTEAETDPGRHNAAEDGDEMEVEND